MLKTSLSHLRLLPLALLLTALTTAAHAEKTVADLDGEDKERYETFRRLFLNAAPEEFYAFAGEYARELRRKGYMMLYYKLLSNKGFYALRHHQVYRAIRYAQALDQEVRSDKAAGYYYLATGLYGDIYSSSHDRARAEAYFRQALDEVGDRDQKFTMRVYLSLAEMFSLKDAPKALDWAAKAIATARKAGNTDYLSMALAIQAYVFFIKGDAQQFFSAYEQYDDLRSQAPPEFNHRYDNILEAARAAFNMQYDEALAKVAEGNLAVDSSLAVISIYVLKGDLAQGFEAMKRRSVEMDSLYSLLYQAGFNQLAAETTLMRSREEAAASRSLARQLTNWLIALTVVYLFVYIMGRRRLVRKIWAKNKDLRAALSRAEESDRMKTTFIQSMSHEIRTPLNAVSGFAEVICSPDFELSDAEKRDMQARISDNVAQITAIINELLELSQSESEAVIPDSEKTDVCVNSLARTVISECKGRQKTGVELRFTSAIGDASTVRTNAHRLKSALKHLMDNAIKFTDIGHIELRCEHDGDRVRFIVTDTGCGIRAEDRERIFDTFQKGDDFMTGVGLGLPICRRLIRSLGGDVSLDPAYTNGARFIITI